MWGLVVGVGGVEVVAGGERVGTRWFVDEAAVGWLEGVGERYRVACEGGGDDGVLLGLGRELYAWLEGDEHRLSRLVEQAPGPFVLEVRGPRRPSPVEWAVLGAPFELLADERGFLAEDRLLRFGVQRRLGDEATAPELGGWRLGVAFMASSPRGVEPVLDFEAEESALLGAVRDANLDVLVDDSGDPHQLRDRLAAASGLQVLHLSCHGFHRRAGGAVEPVLVMEDEFGGRADVDAGRLVGCVTAGEARLVFVSACLSAADAGVDGGGRLVASSLASGLVQAGVPSVVGWDGSVADASATRFAAQVYAGLARREPVAVAVGEAVRSLLGSGVPAVRSGWHLARVWVGPSGGGPLVDGARKRAMVPATHGHVTFLDKKSSQVPVASYEMFVGRRRQVQQSLRALSQGTRSGVVLHGMGRSGKSSLAARIANRRSDLALAVVFGHYDAVSVLDAIGEAVKGSVAASDLVERALTVVRDDPSRLEGVLIGLLTGPCQQADDQGRPLLLVLDDLEQILEPGDGAVRRVDAAHAPVIGAVVRAFDPVLTDSRLLITSRFEFVVDDAQRRLAWVPLPPMSDVDRRKLRTRQVQAAAAEGRAAGTLSDRGGLVARAVTIARGNPGLQDLLVSRLVLSPVADVAAAAETLGEMERWLEGGDLPGTAEVRAFLEGLAIDALLEQAGSDGRDLARSLTVFALPVPVGVAETVAEAVGGSVDRLRGLGLLDVFDDVVDHQRQAVAVNQLAAGRLTPLSDAEQTAVVTVAAGPLFEAWGGADGHRRRPRQADAVLTVLALAADDPTIVATCAADALKALEAGPASNNLAVAQAAIGCLDRAGRPVPLPLLLGAIEVADRAGEGAQIDRLLERADSAADRDEQDPVLVAAVHHKQGQRQFRTGDLDSAQRHYEQARELLTQVATDREVAILAGQIADILQARGELDEALRIRREDELPVYQRLGDIRSEAITKGQIADILQAVGDPEAAAQLQQERLQVNRGLGDADGVAAALWDLAQLDLARSDLEAAAPKVAEAYPIVVSMGRLDGIAVIGTAFGQLLIAAGQRTEGLEVLRHSREAFEQLGDAESARQIADLVGQIERSNDE